MGDPEDAVDAYNAMSEAMQDRDSLAAKDALRFLLTRIGSWTNARWDQHLRNELGDERAQQAIDYIEWAYDVSGYSGAATESNSNEPKGGA